MNLVLVLQVMTNQHEIPIENVRNLVTPLSSRCFSEDTALDFFLLLFIRLVIPLQVFFVLFKMSEKKA